MAASVLLVDDERDFVEAMAERLRLRGLQTDTACDAAGALDRLHRGGVEVVVLDVQMPGRTGIEAMEDMRALDPAVQIVLLTGQASVGSAVEGMKRGAFDYLTKPAEVDSLAETIRRAQGRYASLAENLRMQETAKLAVVGQLAEGVAHEINTPLSVLSLIHISEPTRL